MKANSKTLLFWKFYNLLIVLQAQEVQRSFWNLPKIFQNGTTDILSEHEYCIIILKNEARLDHNYINACEKWMKYHFYANFDPKIIEKNKLVERSFWFIPIYFQKYTGIESEHIYCRIIIQNQVFIEQNYVEACSEWIKAYFTWQKYFANQLLDFIQFNKDEYLRRHFCYLKHD